MYIYMCIYIYIYIYICEQTLQPCQAVYLYMYIYTHLCVFIYIYVYIHTHIYIHTYTCIGLLVHIQGMWTNTSAIHICLYIYIHISRFPPYLSVLILVCFYYILLIHVGLLVHVPYLLIRPDFNMVLLHITHTCRFISTCTWYVD
jgi:hypothetical protein